MRYYRVMKHVGETIPVTHDTFHEVMLRTEIEIAISRFSRGELKQEHLEQLLRRFVVLVNANRGELEKIIAEQWVEDATRQFGQFGGTWGASTPLSMESKES